MAYPGVVAAPSAALTKIAATTLGADTLNIDFSSIPGTYASLVIELIGRTTAGTSNEDFRVQCNGDTGGTQYEWNYMQMPTTSGSVSCAAASSAAYMIGGYLPGANPAAGMSGTTRLHFSGYANTSLYTRLESHSHRTATHPSEWGVYLGRWKSTAALTSIRLIGGTVAFVSGTRAILYGVST